MSSSEDARRVFFALWPGQTLRRRLVEVQGRVPFEGKPVAAPNLHLTLIFIGSASLAYLRCLQEAAEAVHFENFNLYLNRLGYFVKPRTLWLGPTEPPPALHRLHQALVECLATSCGYEREDRPFRPHVTLARKAREAQEQAFEPVPWRVDRFCLVESRLSDKGADYQIIQTYFSDSHRR